MGNLRISESKALQFHLVDQAPLLLGVERPADDLLGREQREIGDLVLDLIERLARLGRDVVGVLDGLGIAKINWCGLSMGGMVGMWLGANAGNRIDKLILSNTSSYFPDKTMWDGRIKLVREKGLEGIVDANMERWFTKGFRDRAPEAMAQMKKMFVATKLDGYIGCGEAIRDMDHRPLLSKITAPTLVIAGKHDPATPLEGNEFIKQHIPGARIAVLEAAHIANIEQPQVYADTVLGFLLN
jgi:3-oxoadipate enol-lactonase